jgi:hypothetical protein
MIDRPGRRAPRFPPECEGPVASALTAQLDALGAGPDDLAITQGACGADLLFAEAMLERGAALRLYLPMNEEIFIARSVAFEKAASTVPDRWGERFVAVKKHASTRVVVMSADHDDASSENVFERCNAWMLERALAFGADKVRFLSVWNGAGGDGPGGTDHMRRAVKERGGAEFWIDTRTLCGHSTPGL